MYLLWGSIVIAIGLFFFICASMRSEFFIYQIFVDRARIKWKDKVYLFHKIMGIIIINLGLLIAMNFF